MEKTKFIDQILKSFSQTFSEKVTKKNVSIEQLEMSNALLDDEINDLKKRMDDLEAKIDVIRGKKYARKIRRSKLSRYCDNKLDIAVSVDAVDILEQGGFNHDESKRILIKASQYAKRENEQMILEPHVKKVLKQVL